MLNYRHQQFVLAINLSTQYPAEYPVRKARVHKSAQNQRKIFLIGSAPFPYDVFHLHNVGSNQAQEACTPWCHRLGSA